MFFNFKTNKKRFVPEEFIINKSDKWIILSDKHTQYIANLVLNSLIRNGLNGIIINDTNHKYTNNPYIIICPQLFNKNYPQRTIFYQMEQSTSPWFSKKYLNILKKATFIFDYSLFNIENLILRGFDISRIFYMPIDFIKYENNVKNIKERTTDILFYGSLNEHRNNLLKYLSSFFKIKILTNVFGEQLQQELNNAKIVMNIHYYKNSILETTRIYESLVNGCIVLSEKTQDMHMYNMLKELVVFFDYNEMDLLETKIKKLLLNIDFLIDKQQRQIELINCNISNYDFYMSQFLDYCGYKKGSSGVFVGRS